MTFLTVAENLKIGEMASQLSFQRFMEFGYLGAHFSVTRSKAEPFAYHYHRRSYLQTFFHSLLLRLGIICA